MATIKSLRILMYVDHSRMSGALQKAKDKVQTAAMSMAKALATGFAAREIGRSVVASIKEAMKMESMVVAPSSGTVKSVDVGAGDSVQEGQVLVTIG